MPCTSAESILKIQKSVSAIESLMLSRVHDALDNYRSVLDALNEAACLAGPGGETVHVNEAFERTLGRSASSCAGQPFTLLFEEGEANKAASFHSRAMNAERFVAGLTLNGAASKALFRFIPLIDWHGRTQAVCLIACDSVPADGLEEAVSRRTCELTAVNRKLREELAERENAESEKLVFLTNHDPVTGLYNRTHFIEILGARLERPATGTGALLLLDIDQFKFISDSYGHGMGDEFLRRIGKLLQVNARYLSARVLRDDKDALLLSRLSGDEFAVFLPAASAAEALEAAEHIRDAIESFFQPDMHCHMTASTGIALFPEHGRTASELLTKADAAMYRAKDRGRNRCHLYSPEEREIEQMHMRLKWKERILAALKDGRFEPWYQPIMGLADNRVTHYEVLARMTDLDGTVVLPGPFIDIAERFGLVGAITRAVFSKAFALQAGLRKEGSAPRLCLNISGKDLGDDSLLHFLRSGISENGLDPSTLVFEITETASIHDLDRAMSFIAALKETGCHVALDDFGIGFTSFLYLRELKVDYIKIAGSFIRSLDKNLNDQLFVKAITEVARGMNIRTIGEFVENAGVLASLRKFGVDYAQGYIIGKPAPSIPGQALPPPANGDPSF